MINPVLTPEGIKAACAGTWLARPAEPTTRLPGVSIDSRTLRPGQVFIAIAGEVHDGHAFVPAIMPLAGLVIVEREVPLASAPAGLGVLKVASTRRALLALAAAHRRSLATTRVVAVAGSNGKTTTVRLIDAALNGRLRGSFSPKSFNNDIGVPLTLLAARPGDHYVICEVGTNAPGEIAALAAVVQPDVAVITSIGREHLAFLGSVDGVVREEAAILSEIRPGGLGVIPADVPQLAAHAGRAPSVVTFGRDPRADLRLTRVKHEWEGTGESARPCLRFELNDRLDLRIPLVGEHNAMNALAAVAVARRLGLDDESIARGLSSANGPEMRWQRALSAGVEVINDAYNANPDSALAAIRTFAELYPPRASGSRVLVLGDMLELGDHAPAAHREIGLAIAQAGCFERVITVGSLARLAADACQEARPGLRVEALADLDAPRLAASLAPGDVVLLKGSRRNRLERVAAALAARGPAPVVEAPDRAAAPA